jgi:hypothetical protein
MGFGEGVEFAIHVYWCELGPVEHRDPKAPGATGQSGVEANASRVSAVTRGLGPARSDDRYKKERDVRERPVHCLEAGLK